MTKNDIRKKEIYTFTVMVVLAGMAIITVGDAFATHISGIPLWHGHRWWGSSTDMSYDCFSLNRLNIGCSGATTQLDSSRTTWNNLATVWTFNKDTANDGPRWITAAPYADTNLLAVTTPHTLDLFGRIVDVDTEFNNNIQWVTGTNQNGKNFRVTANHEFAHWVDFNDLWDDIDTIAYRFYDYDIWNSPKTRDNNQLVSIYG